MTPSKALTKGLVSAAQLGQTEVVQCLLKVIPQKILTTAVLANAMDTNNSTAAALLLPHCSKPTLALQMAARHGFLQAVQTLLSQVHNRRIRNLALIEAAKHNHMPVAQYLLPYTNARAQESKALQEAADAGNEDMVRFLLPHSDPLANPLANHSHAIQQAAWAGHLTIVALLAPPF